MRAVPEWIGKTDDAKVPPRVVARILERYKHKCYLTGVDLVPGADWQLDHIVALCNGGRHCESNLAPAVTAAHKRKTASDVAIKAKVAAVRGKHFAPRIVDEPPKLQGQPFPQSRKAHTRSARGHKAPVKRTHDVFGARL